MSLILNIDTAIETASICLAEKGTVIHLLENTNQNEHAAWIHLAIKKLMQETGYGLQDIEAVAISAGPGSYTGLRVGMSTAKGLCYALNIPLITISTLKIMAWSASQLIKTGESGNYQTERFNQSTLLCPMIDARRMEVFTAVYNKNLAELLSPQAFILNYSSFTELLDKNIIIFFGNGSIKLQNLVSHPNAYFTAITCDATHMVQLSYEYFIDKIFADLAYAEPYYIKGFFTSARKLPI